MKKFLNEKAALLLFLAACPCLGATTTVIGGVTMGVVLCLVLVLTSLVLSALKNVVTNWVGRFFVGMFFACGLQLLIHAFIPTIYNFVGSYVACVACSLVLFEAGKDASEKSLKDSVLSSLFAGCFFVVVLFVVATLREVLGNASFAGLSIGFLADCKISLLTQSFGGFLVYGLVLGCIQAIFKLDAKKVDLTKEDC